MPVLKYYDAATSTWKYASTDPDDPGLVSTSGGEMVGPLPLMVDAGTVSYDITVDGKMTAKKFTTTKAGVLNVGIRITPEAGRVINFGGAKVQEVGDSTEGDSVVTKSKVDTFTTTLDAVLIALNGTDWVAPGAQPWVQLDREGCVSMEGVVKCSTTIDPADSAVVGNLPDSYRPRTKVALATFAMFPAPRYALLEILPNGDVVYREGPRLTPGCTLSLGGSFYTTGGGS